MNNLNDHVAVVAGHDWYGCGSNSRAGPKWVFALK
jgi:hypothetical protein